MIDAGLQISAGICLIKQSGLLELTKFNTFSTRELQDFEIFAQQKHLNFGRVMCWVLFSTGVEYLCKGYLVSKESLLPTTADKIKLANASDIDDAWTGDVLNRNPRVISRIDVYDQLGGVAQRIGNVLIKKNNVPSAIAERTRSVLTMFTDAIRNRDAHVYYQKVREDHFDLTKPMCEALNVIMGAIDPETLKKLLVERNKVITRYVGITLKLP